MSNPEILEMRDLEGLPRYLKNKIPIYPIKVRNAVEFYDCVSILNIPKNETDNVEVLKMSYLKFLIILSATETEVKTRFFKLLNLIFNTTDIQLFENNNGKFSIIIDNDLEVTEFDFGKIRKIVSEQNMIDLEDENMNPELKKKIKEAEKFMSNRGNSVAPFKQRILAYQYESKMKLSEILDMTLYQFNSSLEVIAHIKQADLLQQARFAGMKTFKDESSLPTWLSAIEKTKQNPLLLDADKLTKEMKSTFGT